MSKFVNPDVFDSALAVIATATRMVAVNGQPKSYAEADAGKLAEAELTSADFAVSDGDVSGRKVTVSAKYDVAAITAGTADHIALLDPMLQRLLYVTTCPAQALIKGGSVSIASWAVEIGSPA